MVKKLMSCCTVLCILLAVQITVSPAQEQATQAPPQARKIPGITAEDRYPNACVDCHINYVDMKLDTRFSTLMSQWSEEVEPQVLAKAQAVAPKDMTLKGKHPEAASALKDIPAKCLACHSKTPKTSPPFAAMIHNIHLTGGNQNNFMTIFQGECTHCHKLDLSSGHLTIPSAPEK